MEEKEIKEANNPDDMNENDDKYVCFIFIDTLCNLYVFHADKTKEITGKKSELAYFSYQLFCQKQLINCYSESVF